MTWIGRLFPYVGLLEREVERLQLRERELLNVVLPKVGATPLDQPERKKIIPPKGKPSRLQRAMTRMRQRATEIYVPIVSKPRPDQAA